MVSKATTNSEIKIYKRGQPIIGDDLTSLQLRMGIERLPFQGLLGKEFNWDLYRERCAHKVVPQAHICVMVRVLFRDLDLAEAITVIPDVMPIDVWHRLDDFGIKAENNHFGALFGCSRTWAKRQKESEILERQKGPALSACRATQVFNELLKRYGKKGYYIWEENVFAEAEVRGLKDVFKSGWKTARGEHSLRVAEQELADLAAQRQVIISADG